MKNFEFEMRIVGECRGYFFKGEYEWEDKNLIEGLGRVKVMGEEKKRMLRWDREELEKIGSVDEVIRWLESDCIGGGEESFVEIKVNGEVVFENEVGIWEFDNVDDGEWCDGYMGREEEKWGEDIWEKYEESKKWYRDRLERMK